MEAERACLGAAIIDNSMMRGPLGGLSVADFALAAHRELFSKMLESDEEGLPFDTLTLVESLREHGRLEGVGGAAYVDSLTDGVVPHAGLIRRHAETVIRQSRRRQVKTLCERGSEDADAPGADPTRVLEKLIAAGEGILDGCDLDGNLPPVSPQKSARRPDLLTLATVEAKDVDWLWKPYLPYGMLAMLNGDPGAGKTFVALAVAADVTVGRLPFDGGPCAPADVLYLSVENSPEYVLRPRFDSLGGDPNRFHILRGSTKGNGKSREQGTVRLSDVQLLGDAISQTRAQLVIVDPIQSYLGAEVDAYRSNETRPVMDGLSLLCEANRCLVWLLRHLGKAQTARAIHRGLGSIDLTGAVRTELLAGCAADDPAERALVHLKTNLGQLGPSLGFSIDGNGLFRWTGKSDLTASAILAPERNGEEFGALAEAKGFLLDALARGPRSSKDIECEAEQLDISGSTLKRAKKALRVLSVKSGMEGGWEWSLPEGDQE